MIHPIRCAPFIFLFGFCRNVEFGANPSQGKCGKVHLTVSSFHDTHLEMNWITNCPYPDTKPDYIALYNHSLIDRNEESVPIVQIYAANYPDGYYKTKIKFGQPWLPGNWEYRDGLFRPDPGSHCYPYWIVSFRENRIIDMKCFGIHPTWMQDNSDEQNWSWSCSCKNARTRLMPRHCSHLQDQDRVCKNKTKNKTEYPKPNTPG